MWQSYTLLRSETLLMCSQGPFQLAGPHSCSCGWKVPSTHLVTGLAHWQHLALGHLAKTGVCCLLQTVASCSCLP